MISNQPESLIDKMRVSSPCPASWDAMKGDDNKRFCQQCNLHVYNISAMTRREAEDLIRNTEGRLCARFYRRSDGTVLTQDCPVGLKALRRCLKMRLGVFLPALFGLTLTAFGQETKSSNATKPQIEITRTVSSNTQNEFAIIKGTVFDEMGAVIPEAKVVITNENTKKVLILITDDEGSFISSKSEAGNYSLQIEANGFQTYTEKELNVESSELITFSVILKVGEVMGDITIVEQEVIGTVEAQLGVPVKIEQIKNLPVMVRNPFDLINLPKINEKKDLPKKRQ